MAPLPAPLAGAHTATDNPTVTWDENAQTAIWDLAVQQPNEQVRSFAMVSGAVYDAVNATSGMPYEPYLLRPSARRRGSTRAATSTIRRPNQTEAAIFWHDRRSVNWGSSGSSP